MATAAAGKVDIIDLTDETEGQETNVASLTTQQEEEDPTEEEETPLVQLGSFECPIVGIQYYSGIAHPGEYVTLIREPRNPYDSNAIRVDNMAGIKVGHIKKTVARVLAPVMDRMEVQIDATIPYRGNDYTLPCAVELCGTDPEVSIAEIDQIFKGGRHRWVKNPLYARKSKKKAAIDVTSATVHWQEAQKDLDALFDKMTQEQLAKLPKVDPPSSLTSELLEHQVQGIRWLYKRETEDTISPFFKEIKEGGRNVWFSDITNSSQVTAPKPCRGSILADDMGLGKTIMAIGLVLSNPPKNVNDPKTTLVICPVSVMSNWIHQIEQHVAPGTLKVAMYHGSERHALLNDGYDVLVTSYGTLSSDFSKFFTTLQDGKPKKKKARKGSIFDHMFRRVILDEAHIIRNTKAKFYKSVTHLQSRYRLCLTGTPLQNKPEDIQSLFAFLEVDQLSDTNIFRRAISQPIRNGEDVGLARLRTMMADVALRRNKNKLSLVPKSVELRSIEFPADSPHTKIHQVLFDSAQTAFRATLRAGTNKPLKNYMMILETLMRIRQACIAGNLVPKDRLEAAEQVLKEVEGKDDLSAEEGEQLLQKLKGALEQAMECAVCLEELNESEAVILRACNHVFCANCIGRVAQSGSGNCPLCRQAFKPVDMIKHCKAIEASESTNSPKSITKGLEQLEPSPKLLALELAIGEMQDDEKGVIFSQFTSFLDLLQLFLDKLGHSYVRIDGSKSAKKRLTALTEFNKEDGPRFILCSLHAAGTGITLTRANHCFMMDTWWNVSVENQAMDRVHRIGQTRPVKVIRFVMKDSIEERMIKLQEAKAALGKGAMQKLKPEEVRKARLGDLINLFSVSQ